MIATSNQLEHWTVTVHRRFSEAFDFIELYGGVCNKEYVRLRHKAEQISYRIGALKIKQVSGQARTKWKNDQILCLQDMWRFCYEVGLFRKGRV